MKELEHVLDRVRVAGAPLQARVFDIARVIAARTLDPDRGVQIAVEKIAEGSHKKRSTVKTALRELCALKIINRNEPPIGAKYATHIFRFNQILIEASEKSRPYLGENLIFPPANLMVDGVPEETANFCKTKPPETRMKLKKNAVKGGQLLTVKTSNEGGSTFDPYMQSYTPPPVISTVEACQGQEPGISPAPPGGGVCSIPPPGFILEESILEDMKIFADFLEKNKFGMFSTFCQRRKKKDGRRGGTFGRRRIGDLEDLTGAVAWAGQQKFELTMSCRGLLLVDDLDKNGVELVQKSGLEAAILETSSGNFQALFVGESGWSDGQIRDGQKSLVARFGGDTGATAATQLHRLPGSLNQKDGGCFVSRLEHLQAGERVAAPPLIPIAPALASVGRPSKKVALGGEGGDQTESGKDFTHCFSLLRRGHTVDQVAAEILSRAADRGRTGNNHYYSRLTAANALAAYKPRP